MFKAYDDLWAYTDLNLCPACDSENSRFSLMLCKSCEEVWKVFSENLDESDTSLINQAILEWVNDRRPYRRCAECEERASQDDYLCPPHRELTDRD